MCPARRLARDGSPAPSPAGAALLASFRHAFRGLVEVTAGDRNMKIHVFAGVALGVVGGELALPLASRLALLLCTMLVLSAELLNTALESFVDLHTSEMRHEARRVKDSAAAAVLVLAIGSVLAASAILAGSWSQVAASLPRLRARAPAGVAVLMLTAWLLAPVRRRAVVDVLGTAGGGTLLVALALQSLSLAFTGMAMGLFALAAASAWYVRAHLE